MADAIPEAHCSPARGAGALATHSLLEFNPRESRGHPGSWVETHARSSRLIVTARRGYH
jgi:hypothetical protein